MATKLVSYNVSFDDGSSERFNNFGAAEQRIRSYSRCPRIYRWWGWKTYTEEASRQHAPNADVICSYYRSPRARDTDSDGRAVIATIYARHNR